MVFSSVVFVFYFLPVLLTVYLMVAGKWRNTLGNIWLLIASLVFYAWGEATYLDLLLGTVALNYVAGLILVRYEGKPRRAVLAVGIAANLLLLGYYKYAGFSAGVVSSIVVAMGGKPLAFEAPRLPLGISFFIFQSMSYLLDVHRKEAAVERNPLYLTLYVTLFSQLVAGPILRFADVADQIRSRTHRLSEIARGASEFIIGLAQKALVANTMAAAADAVFAEQPQHLSAAAAWFGIIAYALQIYFDFSGYSHMAIGLGRICGFSFVDNFNFPYASQSVTEFWRRWHMTLSTWFRDYLYIPLGGNRLGTRRTAFNLFAVFFLCGLWHGAAWQFIVWGLFHGALLSIERMGWGKRLERLPRFLRHSYTLMAVLIGWVFFRADTLSYATRFLGTMFGVSMSGAYVHDFARFARADVVLVGIVACLASSPFMMTSVESFRKKLESASERPLWFDPVRALVVIPLLAFSLISISSGSLNPFIYFRF